MQRRHGFPGFSSRALLEGWRLRQVLPWTWLLLTATTLAYGVQLAGASMLPATEADRRDAVFQQLSRNAVSADRAPSLLAASTPPTHMVLITAFDAMPGDQTQVVCVTAGDRISSDAVLVQTKDFRQVAAQICNLAIAP